MTVRDNPDALATEAMAWLAVSRRLEAVEQVVDACVKRTDACLRQLEANTIAMLESHLGELELVEADDD